MQLENYVTGRWIAGRGELAKLRDATTGEVIAETSSGGLDFRAILEHARQVGGPALRRLTFHERAAQLKALARYLGGRKEELYTLSYATGATRSDSWIDIEGGIGTVFVFASKGVREMPNSQVYVDGAPEALSKSGGFVGQHVYLPLEGAAVHINAFNFPCWGMLEKFAPAFLAGVPAIVKPATSTSFLTEAMVRMIAESGILPEGSLQLICGSAGDLFNHLGCQDIVSFTGSAATAASLRRHASVIAHSVRFVAETDSLNSSLLGPDARPGTPEFDLFVQEIVREMTVKAGQKCTAIRKALVPLETLDAVLGALEAALRGISTGDPRQKETRMGPLVSLSQRREVRERIAELAHESEVILGGGGRMDLRNADAERGAFIAPTLLA
ncbi:MAG: 3,4-dehydroadipyl-CoA semialdehyde dehydrogenase, partial [Steroidobacteraceae bacterium]